MAYHRMGLGEELAKGSALDITEEAPDYLKFSISIRSLVHSPRGTSTVFPSGDTARPVPYGVPRVRPITESRPVFASIRWTFQSGCGSHAM